MKKRIRDAAPPVAAHKTTRRLAVHHLPLKHRHRTRPRSARVPIWALQRRCHGGCTRPVVGGVRAARGSGRWGGRGDWGAAWCVGGVGVGGERCKAAGALPLRTRRGGATRHRDLTFLPPKRRGRCVAYKSSVGQARLAARRGGGEGAGRATNAGRPRRRVALAGRFPPSRGPASGHPAAVPPPPPSAETPAPRLWCRTPRGRRRPPAARRQRTPAWAWRQRTRRARPRRRGRGGAAGAHQGGGRRPRRPPVRAAGGGASEGVPAVAVADHPDWPGSR